MSAKYDHRPTLIMLIGLPGSGKSTFAQKFKDAFKIHSSDSLRLELYGSESNNDYNNALFEELHRRILRDLKDGNNVVYDATNLSKKRRRAFLKNLNIPCTKICFVIAEDFKTCVEQNDSRERIVPHEVIERMRRNYNPPWYEEGWDDIRLHFRNDHPYLIPDLSSNDFDQENEHHTLSFWDHSKKVAEYIQNHYPDDYLLYYAALIHDVGKMYTKSRLNSKGEDDGNCHYYNHNCVGAYESMFYAKQEGFSNDDILYISNLVYYHMHPFSWDKMKDEAKEKAINKLGRLYSDVAKIHEADLYAH